MNEKVLMKGNEAIAEAAIAAGCRHFFGYPITPQTEVAAYMSKMSICRPSPKSRPSTWSSVPEPPASGS